MTTHQSQRLARSTSITGRRTPVAVAVSLALAGAMPLAHAGSPAPGAARGENFQVNTTTGGQQTFPAVAMDADGDYVAVWADLYTSDIVGQRYHADGTADGSEFIIDAPASAQDMGPSVAMDAAGDFVVAWQLGFPAPESIFARRYGADGEPLGAAFKVDTATNGQASPVVAMDAAGDFIVAWTDKYADGSGTPNYGVEARRYTVVDGGSLNAGTEFQVNTTTSGDQHASSVAMDAAGDFVIAWEDTGGADGSGYGVFARRYAADGSAGDEVQLNTYTDGNQRQPLVAMDAAGGFVAVWVDVSGEDGDGYGIFARRYQPDGNPAGGEFQVNTRTSGRQEGPSVSMDVAGDFVVAWVNDSISSDADVVARRYDGSGAALDDAEFLVNTQTSGDQQLARAAMDAAGDFVVVWDDKYATDGDQDGIFGQRYARSSSLDLEGTLALAPADTVKPGGDVTLTAGIDNLATAATTTGNATVDTALTTANGLTATLTLPDGVTFGKATGTHWTCPATPTDNVLTCTYDVSLAAATSTENLTVTVTAPDSAGETLAFTNVVAGRQPDAANSANNTAAASVDISDSASPHDDTGTGDTGGSDSGNNDTGSSGGGDSGNTDTGGSGSNANNPSASSSGGGGGAFGFLGFGLLGLALRRKRGA